MTDLAVELVWQRVEQIVSRLADGDEVQKLADKISNEMLEGEVRYDRG